MNEQIIRKQYNQLTKKLIDKNITITTMESATSGQIASLITDAEGSSAILKGAFVTYSNEAKIMQGVPKECIDVYGVYSKETSKAMAKACRETYKANIGIGITGSFGNADPNNADSVPGVVYYTINVNGDETTEKLVLPLGKERYEYKYFVAEDIVAKLMVLVDVL